eukprot:gene23084-biopygen10316
MRGAGVARACPVLPGERKQKSTGFVGTPSGGWLVSVGGIRNRVNSCGIVWDCVESCGMVWSCAEAEACGIVRNRVESYRPLVEISAFSLFPEIIPEGRADYFNERPVRGRTESHGTARNSTEQHGAREKSCWCPAQPCGRPKVTFVGVCGPTSLHRHPERARYRDVDGWSEVDAPSPPLARPCVPRAPCWVEGEAGSDREAPWRMLNPCTEGGRPRPRPVRVRSASVSSKFYRAPRVWSASVVVFPGRGGCTVHGFAAGGDLPPPVWLGETATPASGPR